MHIISGFYMRSFELKKYPLILAFFVSIQWLALLRVKALHVVNVK